MNNDFMYDISDEQLELVSGGHHHHHCHHAHHHDNHQPVVQNTTIIYYTIVNNTFVILNSPQSQIISAVNGSASAGSPTNIILQQVKG